MKRILVPHDGSALSARALPVAETIAREQGAEIVLVRVIEPQSSTATGFEAIVTADLGEELTEAYEIAARQELGVLAERIEERGGRARVLTFTGMPAAGLLNIEKDLQPDLIVIGSHGRSGFTRFALGSVTERLVREGDAPVLVVHQASPTARPLDLALVPLDGSPLAETALLMVESLAGAPLHRAHLLRVVSDPAHVANAESYLDSVATRLERARLLVTTEVLVGDPAQVIQTVAPEASLVIVATHGRSGLDRLRHGSVAEQVTRHVQTPVLMVRAIAAPVAIEARAPMLAGAG
jgi:nucleotide-binding universal stress UspA family protein